MYRLTSIALCAVFLTACSVEIDDLTTSPLVYNPPVNAQDFRVRVRSNTRVDSVDISIDAGAPTAMAEASDGEYVATALVPSCTEVANYAISVDGRLFGPRTFPREGRFAREVSNLPDACDGLASGLASTYVVDRRDDFVDINPGDDICFGTAASGVSGCSLRAAIMEANASRGDDLIVLQNGRYTISLTGSEATDAINDRIEDFDITENVTIERRNGTQEIATRSLAWPGNDTLPALSDNPSRDTRFTKIDANNLDRVFQVRAGATLRLRFVALVSGRTSGSGGAVRNDGILTTERVIMVNNTARSVGGQDGGAAVFNSGTMLATDSLFARNQVTGSSFRGGAITNATGGDVTVKRSLFAFNGARFGTAIANFGTLDIENAAFHGNFIISGNGGVINNSGTVDLNHVTFSSNENPNRSWNILSGDRQRVRNSLFIGNRRGQCGRIDSIGGNVSDVPCTSTSGRTPLLPDSFDLFGTPEDPQILSNEGGFLPLPISRPRVSSQLNGTAGVPTVPRTDARGPGFPRLRDAAGAPSTTSDADAGAFEY